MTADQTIGTISTNCSQLDFFFSHDFCASILRGLASDSAGRTWVDPGLKGASLQNYSTGTWNVNSGRDDTSGHNTFSDSPFRFFLVSDVQL